MKHYDQEYKGLAVRWYIREYENDYSMPVPDGGRRDDGLVYDSKGNCLNTLVWEDPAIKDGTNFNQITNAGKQMVFGSMFALSGSGTFLWMAYGASSTAYTAGSTHLTYEHILDGTRIPLKSQTGVDMTQANVVGSTSYTDTNYLPNITYVNHAVVMGTINGASSLNVNQPIRDFGINTTAACPGTPTGSSGTFFNLYVLDATRTLSASSTLQILLELLS